MKRVGQAIKINPEYESEYRRLHAEAWPGVIDMLKKCNVQNYSIFILGEYMFAYFEYVGNDYEGDMKRIEEDPCSMEWEKLCNKCQLPFEAGQKVAWSDMEEIFYMK